jgi:hypothetical protein
LRHYKGLEVRANLFSNAWPVNTFLKFDDVTLSDACFEAMQTGGQWKPIAAAETAISNTAARRTLSAALTIDESTASIGRSVSPARVKLFNKPRWHFAAPTRWANPGLPLHYLAPRIGKRRYTLAVTVCLAGVPANIGLD